MSTDVVAIWPGSTHDCHIFWTLAIWGNLEPQPLKTSGGAFNRAHKITRCSIEWTFGLLKRRFHVLHSKLRMAHDRVCIIIETCCTLHNPTVNLREPEPGDCDMDDEGCAADLHTQYSGCETGNAVREHNAHNFFKFLHRGLKLKHTLDCNMLTHTVNSMRF